MEGIDLSTDSFKQIVIDRLNQRLTKRCIGCNDWCKHREVIQLRER
jgi:hypothetical protein